MEGDLIHKSMRKIRQVLVPPPIASPSLAHTPPGYARVLFTGLQEGAVVRSPFRVRFGIPPAVTTGQIRHTAGQHHLLVVVNHQPGLYALIPRDQHRYYDQDETQATLTLPPDRHSLQPLRGDEDHGPQDPPLVSKNLSGSDEGTGYAVFQNNPAATGRPRRLATTDSNPLIGSGRTNQEEKRKMKKTYLTAVAVLTTSIAWAALAAEPEQPATAEEGTATAPAPQTMPMPMPGGRQGGMPMMYGQPGGMPMMQGQPGGMPMMQGQPGNMPMGGTGEQATGESGATGQPGNMPMMQGQPGNMPMYGQPGGMPMMQGHRGMMNPQMMQSRMAIRQQHMANIEKHLANIEALLKELVELQKK